MTARIAVFRPDDGRLAEATDYLASLGVRPVGDPMLEVAPTAARPRVDADVVVVTSPTAVQCLPGDWDPSGSICAIGPRTAEALTGAGYEVDHVPDEYSSKGIVTALRNRLGGARVEIARSDHGSDVLPDGLDEAGAYHHETVLYRLIRPPRAGESTALAATGDLDGALFTSPLTVEHFLEAAAERGHRDATVEGLNGDGIVGVIGEPTREAAAAAGLDVDVVSESATYRSLADAMVEVLGP